MDRMMGMGTKTESLSWWKKTIVYEVYANSFQDSDGDGYGDLNGIRSRLDYLKELGVGAVWLTPVFESPMVDNGYDVADYYAIHPRYGTMEDMDRLIFEAARRGIRIVIDLVFNHTSDRHPWFLKSSGSRDGEYSDWYIWRDPKPDGSAPNNWRGIFGGSAWTFCESRQQYYLHTFAAAQPDLNWENPKVRQALCDIANFWADRGAGGFRLDAIPYIKKPADFSDGPADDSQGMANIHDMTVNTDGILDYLHEFRQKVLDGRDIFTVGEANGVPVEALKDWVGNEGVFNMLIEFSHVNLEFDTSETWCRAKDWKLTDLKRALTSTQEAIAEEGWYPIYFENHDKPRSIDHFFPADADPVLAGRAMGTVLLTLRGTPFLYEGEELGLKNVCWDSIADYDDISSINQYETALREGFSKEEALACVHRFSRDNARTPMQWDTSPGAGFTTGTPWLPVHDDYVTVNAAAEAADPGSVLSWYRTLAAFRALHPVLMDGSYREVFSESEQIYAYCRENAAESLLVLVNFSGSTVEYDPSAAMSAPPAGSGIRRTVCARSVSCSRSVSGSKGSAAPEAEGAAPTEELLLSSYTDIPGAGRAQTGLLRPYEAVILRQ